MSQDLYDQILIAVEAIIERKFREHEIRDDERTRAVLDDLKKEAFPDGPVPHRLSHEAQMKASKSQEDFYNTLKLRVASEGLLGILRILLVMTAIGTGAWIAARFGFLPVFLGWLAK